MAATFHTSYYVKLYFCIAVYQAEAIRSSIWYGINHNSKQNILCYKCYDAAFTLNAFLNISIITNLRNILGYYSRRHKYR